MLLLDEKSDSKDLNFDAHIKLSYDFNPYWRISTFGSYLYGSTENSQFCPTLVWAQGNVYRGEFKKEEWLSNLSLDFNKKIGVHNISALLSGEYRTLRKTAFWVYAKGITSNVFGYDNLGAASTRPYGGTESTYEDQSLASVMGSVTYSLKDRYSLSVNARGDGSSMVGDDHTWGFFPSVSLSWDLKKESFLAHAKHLSLLKLHTGIGQAGNLGGISAYTTMNTVSQTGIVPVKSSPTVTLGTVRNNNPDLKWETKTTFNIGADLGFFANRLMLTAEYYYSKTSDMLYNMPYPISSGISYIPMNLLNMKNQGVEFTLTATPVKTEDFDWTISFNGTHYTNKITSLPEDKRAEGIIHGTASLFRLMEGGSIYDLYTYDYAGVDPETDRKSVV